MIASSSTPTLSGAQADTFDDRFDRLPVGLGRGEELIGGPVIEDPVGHVLAAQRVECPGISDSRGFTGNLSSTKLVLSS